LAAKEYTVATLAGPGEVSLTDGVIHATLPKPLSFLFAEVLPK
jgi:hypothetical protein